MVFCVIVRVDDVEHVCNIPLRNVGDVECEEDSDDLEEIQGVLSARRT